jgi:hypothetical protein
MDLPDLDKAAHAAEALTVGHRGQHRCTDSIYYGPRDAGDCPVSAAVQVLADTIDQVRALPHTAVHDAEHVDLVALGMTGLVMADLAPEDRDGWRLTVRNALEAHAALLDPSVQS